MTREEAIELLSNDAFKLCMVQLCDPLFEDCYEALCMAIEALEHESTAEHSSDVISRQDVIDGLEYEAELCNRALDDMDIDRKERDRFEWELELVECFIEDIKELPSKDRPKWTPCDERLPEEPRGNREIENYLTCDEDEHIYIFSWANGWNCCFNSDGSLYKDQEITDIIAWMPLPKAYKESDIDGSN